MGKPYSAELDGFASTYQWVRQQAVHSLGHFLNRWSGDHVAVVGSGGSFSAAMVISLFRELVHHSPTAAVTPLEFDALLRRLAPRALLLSAEGKNRDILGAAESAQSSDLAAAALTLTLANPLVEFAQTHASIRAFAFQMDWAKDGYLATNSLIATVLLGYRALFGDGDFDAKVGPLMERQRLTARRAYFHSWKGLSRIGGQGLLVLFSAQAKTFAIDLESKLAEAALVSVQIADLRQFAHGRHLQLAGPGASPSVLLVTSTEEATLARATEALLPEHVHRWLLELDGTREQDVAVAGLLDAMFVTEAIADSRGIDPGQPVVPPFGRALHAVDSAASLHPIRRTHTRLELAARRKIGSHGPIGHTVDVEIVEAATTFANRLLSANIKAVVCDFDGTLCRAENRFDRMASIHVEQVSSLLRQGLSVAIATGRGGSLHTELRGSFDEELHASILVGYYSGGLISKLDDDFSQPTFNPAFEDLWSWLRASVYAQHGRPLSEVARGGQLSIRLHSAAECARLLGAVRQWLEREEWLGWRVFSSGHSIDILDPSTSKRNVVARLANSLHLDPLTEILRIGDSGQETGNDYELLGEGLSLSCERVSVDLGSCWNFGAAGNNQVDVTSAYLRGLTPHERAFRLLPVALFGS